jgi:hypothetical protein
MNARLAFFEVISELVLLAKRSTPIPPLFEKKINRYFELFE